MAKEIKAKIKLQLTGGNPSQTKLGPALGQHQVNIGEFTKQFKARTADKAGQTVPVEIIVYTDRSFVFVTKTPPATELILKKANLSKGSSKPQDIVGSISWDDVEEIANIKMSDLNAHSLDQAKKIIAGSARSMGIDVI